MTRLPSPAAPAVLHGPAALKQSAWFAALEARGIRYDAERLALARHDVGPPRPATVTDLMHRALPATRAAIAAHRRRGGHDDGPEAA